MKILIIGTGAVASVISRLLSKEKTIERIVCASRNLNKARQFIVPRGKISLRQLDASKISDIVAAASGMNLIINASLSVYNEKILESALAAGVNYQDLCSHLADLKTPEQLKFHEPFRRAGLVGMINTGVSPGITNLLARNAVDRLERVDEIKIRTIEEQTADELVFSWSPKETFDEITAPPLIYDHGRYRFTKLFGDPEDFDFPAPFGTSRVISIYGDEISTLPRYIKVKKVTYKSCGSDLEAAKSLYALVRSDPKAKLPPLPTPGQMIRMIREGRIKNAFFLSVVDVVGKKTGRKVKIRSVAKYPDIKQISRIIPGATYLSYPTGSAAAAFTSCFSKIKTGGIYPPEALPAAIRRDILHRLKFSGAILQNRVSVIG